jgi:ferredoxin
MYRPTSLLLDVMIDAAVDVPFSCPVGTCGTCETLVLDGEVDHRDSLLTEQQRADHDVMYVCVSRAQGDWLSLDL